MNKLTITTDYQLLISGVIFYLLVSIGVINACIMHGYYVLGG